VTADEDALDRLTLDRLLRGFQISRMLRLAADLSVADRIPETAPRSIEGLAKHDHSNGLVIPTESPVSLVEAVAR
jgi:hypothetical protein